MLSVSSFETNLLGPGVLTAWPIDPKSAGIKQNKFSSLLIELLKFFATEVGVENLFLPLALVIRGAD